MSGHLVSFSLDKDSCPIDLVYKTIIVPGVCVLIKLKFTQEWSQLQDLHLPKTSADNDNLRQIFDRINHSSKIINKNEARLDYENKLKHFIKMK